MDASFICPIAGSAVSPVHAAIHVGLTTVVVTVGSILLPLGVRAYRRTAPVIAPQASECKTDGDGPPRNANPRPGPGVRSASGIAALNGEGRTQPRRSSTNIGIRRDVFFGYSPNSGSWAT